ncbi:flagellar type III secretion system pore protein FliP [Piscinibacter gummiphilus]|uniref:Flagellar biosynthetic protein FliP n=1 Tax=Piscinibacter gummiphilus TaxID=946333 RepID=A0A1W6L4Z3_9BURK|nr:flagellar type III secretion system pore protein FliP [Piscinibacter gummiphilus]ARN19343.1 flagellar biosynthetic protein FliP [Piscinibacter gummiphilus]ATU64010.1 flagellar biosynthetic protein FliP [Piscinibacter gummiphilus]GLS93030.1 flagellar biosynthetic protein FliP [Piscinibacter gummiphilus]
MKRWTPIAGLLMVCLLPALAFAAPEGGNLAQARVDSAQMGPLVRTLAGLSLLSFIPAALIAMTSFTRIIVTLSFLRHALGMPETPPNIVLITLALFLTFFTMQPVLEQSHRDGVAPFLDGRIGVQQAMDRGISPLRTFMQRHVRQEDLAAVAEMGRVELPADSAAEVPLRVLVPAFMLSELRAAFTAGFVIFLPFLLIDLVVAAVLMALGMMMVPPVSISLPMKVLLFVLIDGWTLLMRAIAGAYA